MHFLKEFCTKKYFPKINFISFFKCWERTKHALSFVRVLLKVAIFTDKHNTIAKEQITETSETSIDVSMPDDVDVAEANNVCGIIKKGVWHKLC